MFLDINLEQSHVELLLAEAQEPKQTKAETKALAKPKKIPKGPKGTSGRTKKGGKDPEVAETGGTDSQTKPERGRSSNRGRPKARETKTITPKEPKAKVKAKSKGKPRKPTSTETKEKEEGSAGDTATSKSNKKMKRPAAAGHLFCSSLLSTFNRFLDLGPLPAILW